MKFIAILALGVTPSALHAFQVPAKGSAAQRALHERVQADQARFEQGLFEKAGFQPIADVAAQKREIKRALFHDPYMILPVPGVEIERRADGAITLRVIGRNGKGAPTVLPASAWARLSSLQGSLLRPKPYVPWNPPTGRPSVPRQTCHGWIVRFGTVSGHGAETGSWAQCGGGIERPEFRLAMEFARLAVSTRPSCKWDEANAFWSFQKCFAPNQ